MKGDSMLQNIDPHVLHNDYDIKTPGQDDYILVIRDRTLLLETSAPDGSAGFSKTLPTLRRIEALFPGAGKKAVYLLSVDKRGFYYLPEKLSESGSLSYVNIMALRELQDSYMAFASAVSFQLASWYELHHYCGRCGAETIPSETERAIICPKCGHIYYPRISPVVIIAITDGDRILLTRYSKGGYRRRSLVAGFVEIGETLEDTIHREVMEEVGLKVKNLRYCQSQPWPFSSSLISGFFAEVDGDPTIRLNTDGRDELAEGIWVRREDLQIEDTSVSLTWDMIRKFKEGKEPG